MTEPSAARITSDDRAIRGFLTPEQYERGLDAMRSNSDLVLNKDDSDDYAMMLNLGRFAHAVLHPECTEERWWGCGPVGNA